MRGGECDESRELSSLGLAGNYVDTATVHFSRTAPLIPSVGFSVDF